MKRFFLTYLFSICAFFAESLHTQNSRTSGSEHLHRIQDQLFEEGFDVPWLSNIKMSEVPKETHSPQEAFKVIEQTMESITKGMGILEHKADIPALFSDTTLDGTKAMAKKIFGDLNMPGTADLIDYSIGKLGTHTVANQAETFDQYSMLAKRMGATSLANQMAPLLQATAPPHPNTMFNLMGSILARSNMPGESVEFVRNMASMYAGGRSPSDEEFHSLVYKTQMQLRNRTQPTRKTAVMARKRSDETYKKTMNYLITTFQLPCDPFARGNTPCFELTVEVHSMKMGPGTFRDGWGEGPPGVTHLALGLTSVTKRAIVNTPFYVSPGRAVGMEFDSNLKMKPISVPYLNATQISSNFKYREAPACIASGNGVTKDTVRMEMCPFITAALRGGSPQLWFGLQLFPLRNYKSDTSVLAYDLLNYGGQLFDAKNGWHPQNNFIFVPFPDVAFTGFYRDMQPLKWWNPSGDYKGLDPGWYVPPENKGGHGHKGSHLRSFSVS